MLLTAEQAFAERMAYGHDYCSETSTSAPPARTHCRARGAARPVTAHFKPDVPLRCRPVSAATCSTASRATTRSAGPWLIFEPVDMGSLDTASGVRTPGVASPQRTYLGLSQRVPVQVLVEMATDMVSQRTIQVTYTNQDGVTGRQAALTRHQRKRAQKLAGLFRARRFYDTGVPGDHERHRNGRHLALGHHHLHRHPARCPHADNNGRRVDVLQPAL